MTHTISSHLNALIEALKDGQLGYATAAKDSSSPELKTLFHQFAAERAEFASDLQQHLKMSGESAEESGSVTGDLHRGWINLKAALSSREDLAILEECERGDRSAVETFEKVLTNTDLGTLRPVLERQLAKISTAHQKVTALRDAREVATR